jgi:hypothetical protein
VVAIPLLYLASVFSFWQLLVPVFVLLCINTPGDSVRYALIPGLAARARMPIERAADRAIAHLAHISLTRPPAQTAYCSGAATNRWWHPSEQK